MDMQGDSPSPGRCQTPPPSLLGVAAVTDSNSSPPVCRFTSPPLVPGVAVDTILKFSPLQPSKKKRRHQVPFNVKVILYSLDELSEIFQEEYRKWQNSEEVLETKRKRILSILMSLR